MIRKALALGALAISTPSMAFEFVGDWGLYEGPVDGSSCSINNIFGDKSINVEYSGAKSLVKISIKSAKLEEFAEESGTVTVSFSPILVKYKGVGEFKKTRSTLIKGRFERKPLSSPEIRASIDSLAILHDLARQTYVRLSTASGEVATQYPLRGSGPAITALRQCVEQQMSRM